MAKFKNEDENIHIQNMKEVSSEKLEKIREQSKKLFRIMERYMST